MIEINYHPHNPHGKGIITVHHIVFHPDQLLDSKCPTEIYFNIPAHKISVCFHYHKKDKNLDFPKLSQVKVGKASRIAWDPFCHQSWSCQKNQTGFQYFQKLEYRIWEDQNIAETIFISKILQLH